MKDEDIHPAALEPQVLLARCEVRRTRRSGPGGQRRNKVETAIVLTHPPTGISAEAGERRSQGENRRIALFRLRVKLALEVRRPLADDYAPSPLWQSRSPAGRIVLNAKHADFPAILAEALDVLGAQDMDVAAAARILGVTASQLVRLLRIEPAALGQVNARRRELDLRPLR